MPYLVGMDEAGYGPNLGPLVVSATAWRVEDPPGEVDLYARLASAVSASAARGETRIAIADSKRLYKPGHGVRLLERGLLPALALLGREVTTWHDAWEALGADPGATRGQLPWYAGYAAPLPLELARDELNELAGALHAALRGARVELVDVCSRAIFPPEFNRAVERDGTKGAALSRATLGLLADVVARLSADGGAETSLNEPLLVVCDKHGGRNRYAALLQEAFPDALVEVRGESRAASLYRWGPPDARVEVRFCSGGEAFLPAALASMACKYLRELAMGAFNAWWCGRVAELRPTAGYPVDARRFRRQIAAEQGRLGIEDRVLWRCR